MPIIETAIGMKKPDRAPPESVMGLPESGPSRRGSTYWRRALSCPREHFMSNILLWAPVRRGLALDIGIVWHAVLEVYYLALMREQQGNGAQNPETPDQMAYRLIMKFQDAEGWSEHAETLSRMMGHYYNSYDHKDRKDWEIVAVEETLEVSADFAGFPYTSRLDLNVLDHSGRTPHFRHVEHKSAGAMDASTISGYTQDLQVLGQSWLMEHAVDYSQHPPYAGCVVNICTKAKETKSIRLPVMPTEAQYEAWEDGMRFGQRLEAAYEPAGYPRNYAHCMRRYGRCQFFDLCQSRPQDSAADLQHFHDTDNLPIGMRKANIWDIEEIGG